MFGWIALLLLFPLLAQLQTTNLFDDLDNCPRYQCWDNLERLCAQSDLPNVKLAKAVCADDEFCYINQKLDGVCIKTASYPEPEKLYPGDECEVDSTTAICAFGPQECDSDKFKCLGYPAMHSCIRTADCNRGNYCHSGVCSPLKGFFDECSHPDACGRTAVCHITDEDSFIGMCTPYFFYDEGEQVGFQISDGKWLQDDMHLLCKSQLMDSSGRCFEGATSTYKGAECSTDTDCSTTDFTPFDDESDTYYATCKCGHTTGGLSFCDLGGKEDEYVLATESFYEYFIETQNCHPGAGFTECGEPALHKEWKCNEFKAKYYTSLIQNPDCLIDMYEDHWFFQDYYNYCLVEDDSLFSLGHSILAVAFGWLLAGFLASHQAAE